MMIEQAIFTSARTTKREGYHLVAASAGLSVAQRDELAGWGPSHDSLSATGERATSIGFHRLACGTPCVSRTISAGDEYSRRGGPRVYTQFLIIPTDVFPRFANNPFAVLRALQAQGSLRVHENVPEVLEPIRLAGRAAACDQQLLSELVAQHGAALLAALVDRALTSQALAIAAPDQAPNWIMALVNCLPVECRLEFSFSTGLKPSAARPTRIVCLDDDAAQRRCWLRTPGAQVFRTLEPPATRPTTAWARLVVQKLERGEVSALATLLAEARPGLQTSGLEGLARRCGLEAAPGPEDGDAVEQPVPSFPRLANLQIPREVDEVREPQRPGQTARTGITPSTPIHQMLQSTWQQTTPGSNPRNVNPSARRVTGAPITIGTSAAQMNRLTDPTDQDPQVFESPTLRRLEVFDGLGRANAASAPIMPFAHQAGCADGLHLHECGCTGLLEDANPEVIELLEELDDLVFDAVAGQPGAVAQLRARWPKVLEQVGPEVIAESRDQYLRHAIGVWRGCTESTEVRDSACAARVMDVLFVLYSD